ncbi:unnamed protein product [Arctogadus glacialis]
MSFIQHQLRLETCVYYCGGSILNSRMSRLRVSSALRVALLCVWLLPAPLWCDNLRCFYSPLQDREQEAESELVVTMCPHREFCFKGVGHYGNRSALTIRGCMENESCYQVHAIRLKGTEYVLSFNCCPWPYCNAAPPAAPSRYLVLTPAAVLLGLAVVRL